jgi:hypothetical protein
MTFLESLSFLRPALCALACCVSSIVVMGCDSALESPPPPESILLQLYRAQYESQKGIIKEEFEGFWIADVAGLHFRKNAKGSPAKLICRQLACADAAPHQALWNSNESFVQASYFDYRFQTVKIGNPNSECFNSTSFAFCAFPSHYGGKTTLTVIINEAGDVWSADLHGKPVIQWPSQEELKTSWMKNPSTN